MKRYFLKITSILLILAVIFILGCHKKNRPPHTPYTPSGPTKGLVNSIYHLQALAIDPDGDRITMRFDWGDGDTSAWASDWEIWVASEQTFSLSHSWKYPDTYYVRTQAKDEKDNISEWSMPHSIIITPNPPNHPPDVPLISGPSRGFIQTSYQFSSSTTDPDEDSITIRFDWGDGETSAWSPWVSSGDSVRIWHSWQKPDTFQVRAQAKDKLGRISEWSAPASIVIVTKGLVWFRATPSASWSPRESHASVVFDNKIWVTGGHYCNDSVWSSSDGVNWACATDDAGFGMRDDFPMVVFDNKIWVIGGGESHRNPKNDVWCSADGVNWTCITNSAQWAPRFEHTAVVFDNKLWVLGGTDNNDHIYNDVWYSTDGVSWICAANSVGWSARKDHNSVVFDNKIWVLGGSYQKDVWYSNDGVNWTQATASAGWSGRKAHTSVVFDNKIWVLGGTDLKVGPRNDVWFSTDGELWVSETLLTIFPERWDHTAVVFNDMIWVLGGIGLNLYNDVWYRTVIEKNYTP